MDHILDLTQQLKSYFFGGGAVYIIELLLNFVCHNSKSKHQSKSFLAYFKHQDLNKYFVFVWLKPFPYALK